MFLHYRIIIIALFSFASITLTANSQITPVRKHTTTSAIRRTSYAPTARTARRGQSANPSRVRKPIKEQVAFLSGDASVTLRIDKPQLIPLGLTYNRVLVIEFPASDKFFRWHGGNSQMIYIDDSPTKKTDNFIVLRAVAPNKGNSLGFNSPVQISIQMRSGLVIPFMIYPTSRETKAAYRCVLRYERDDVLRMRRAEGLAVNLGTDEALLVATETAKAPAVLPPTTLASTSATSPQITDVSATLPIPIPPPTSQFPREQASGSDAVPQVLTVVAEITGKAKKSNENYSEPQTAAKAGLAAAIKEPKQFKRWTRPLHGLTVSTVARDTGERSRLVIVAVRNTNTNAVRIMPGHPDLYVETFGKGGKPVQVERVKRLHTETTTESRVLPAGATVYYALVFETPILGVNQHLRVAVGQTNAADEPTSADLTASARMSEPQGVNQ